MSLFSFWQEYLASPLWSSANTLHGNENSDMDQSNSVAVRDGYEWTTNDGTNGGRQEYWTGGSNMSAAAKAAIRAAGDKIMVVDVRRAPSDADTNPQMRLYNHTTGGYYTPTWEFANEQFTPSSISDPDVTHIGWADVSELYGLATGTVYRLWMGINSDGDAAGSLQFMVNYGKLDCNFRNFCVFDREVFADADTDMASQIAAMEPRQTYLGAEGRTGNPGTGITFTNFAEVVAGDRVTIFIVDFPNTNTFSNVTIGGGTADWRHTEDQSNGQVHLYDAVATVSGPLSVSIDITGGYNDTIVMAHNVGARGYVRSVDNYLHTSAPSTYDLSIDTDPGDLVLFGIKNNGLGALTPSFGSPHFDVDGLLRAIGYITAHRIAKGGTPELIQLDYNTNWIGTYSITAVYEESAGGGSVTGTGALTAPATTVSGSGTVSRSGTGALDIAAAIVAGAGVVSRAGSGNLLSSSAIVAGTGIRKITGTGAVTVPASVLAGSGKRAGQGTGALTIGAITVAGTGGQPGTITGTGALTIPAISVFGEGGRKVLGTGALLVGTTILSGVGGKSSNRVEEPTGPTQTTTAPTSENSGVSAGSINGGIRSV